MFVMSQNEFSHAFSVYRDLTPEKRAQKTMLAMMQNPDGGYITVVVKEIDAKRAALHERLNHCYNSYMAHILMVICVKSDDGMTPEQYYAVTEYVCAKGNDEEESLSLAQYIEKNGLLSEEQAVSVAIQICEGLQAAHEAGVIHRDIKPDNIMMADCNPDHLQVKIIDFGGGKQLDAAVAPDYTVVGTIGFQAPESLSSDILPQSDVYSLGCLLNFMLTGAEPVVKKYKGSREIVSIIEKATYLDPYSRYSSADAMERWLQRAAGARKIDRIPLLRELPGCRTGSLWKVIVAFLGYLVMGELFGEWKNQGIEGFLDIMFLMVWPFVICFNVGNVLQFLPERFRKSSGRFMLARIILILCGLAVLVIYDVYFRDATP